MGPQLLGPFSAMRAEVAVAADALCSCKVRAAHFASSVLQRKRTMPAFMGMCTIFSNYVLWQVFFLRACCVHMLVASCKEGHPNIAKGLLRRDLKSPFKAALFQGAKSLCGSFTKSGALIQTPHGRAPQ